MEARHLVEKESAAVGLLEIALAGGDRTRERALLMAEKFRVDCSLRNCSAVHGNVLLMLTCAELVDNLGEELLARTALSGDKHGEVNRSHPDGTRYGGEQGRGVANYAEALLGL